MSRTARDAKRGAPFRLFLRSLELAALMAATGCTSLPREVPRESSTALINTADTTLGRAAADDLAAHPGESVFYPLSQGTEAFAARIGLIRAAERSLDVQYYMIHGDETGRTLLGELLQAANRGVRVRLLVDDIHTKGEDAMLAALDAHPQIEVRVFNPFRHRSARWVDLLFDYRRVNRRMHNKSLTADSQHTIVGGRNVGNEYFAANSDMNFSDLDVIAAGPVVPEVADAFDLYWNSQVVQPVTALIEAPPTEAAVQAEYARLEKDRARENESAYTQDLLRLKFVQAIREGRLEVYAGRCTVMADPPTKIIQRDKDSSHAIRQLTDLLANAQQELLLVSPYFVPGQDGSKWLTAFPERNVRLRVLTNSYLATDVGAVHAGYMAYRPRLLRAGVELYVMKRDAYGAQRPERDGGGVYGSHASLHAKTYLMDRRTVFIGSLNLDPRSAWLNTEMGLVIESPAFARSFLEKFDPKVLDLAYQVALRPDGHMTWTTRENGREVVLESEPGVGPLRHAGLFITRILPVEEQL